MHRMKSSLKAVKEKEKVIFREWFITGFAMLD